MVDIETYRARIGSFGVSGLSTTKLKLKIKLRCPVQIQVSMECSVQTLIFLCMVTSTMLCVSLHYQEQGNTYTGTTPSHTDSLYGDTQLCIKCLFEHVHELYGYILMIYVVKLTEIALFYTASHRSNLALNIWTPGTNTQTTLMENVFNGTVHGTCSYLIGNVGSHAYNGNPPKNSEQIILHKKMVFKLSHEIAPSMGGTWNTFTKMLCPDLLSDAELAEVKDIFDVFNVLLKKGKIKYGEYEAVKDILSIMEFNTCLDIITEHEEQMTASQDGQPAAKRRKTDEAGFTGTVQGKISLTAEDQQAIKKLERTIVKIYNGILNEALEKGHNILEKQKEANDQCEKSLELVQKMKETFRSKGIGIDKLEDGCLQMTFTYSSYEALYQLYTWYTTKELHDILHDGLITEDVLNELGVTSIKLDISISEEYFSPLFKADLRRDDVTNDTERLSRDDVTAATERLSGDDVTAATERLSRDDVTAVTERLSRDVVTAATEKLSRDVVTAATETLSRDDETTDTERLSRDVVTAATERLSRDVVTTATKRLSRDVVTAVTERLSRDDETAATERLSEDDVTAATERLSGDDVTAVTERLSRDDVTAATERLSRDVVTAATERLSRDDVTSATERLSRDDVTAVTERLSRDDETAVTERMSSDDVTAVTERLSRDGVTAATERLSRDDETAAMERLSRDDETAVTERLSRDDETAVTERLSRDDVTAATERLSRDDETAATERLSRDDVTAATERLSRDDVTAVTERLSRDDETAVTERMSSDDVTAVTERLSRDGVTAATERLSRDDETAATERLSRDDETAVTERLSRDDETAVTERLSRDDVTAATERLSRDDETAATERFSRDDETAVTQRMSSDDVTAVTERLSRDDVTAATERLSRDVVTAATERLSRDDVTSATERLSRDDVTAATERLSRDDVTAVTERLSRDDETAVTERMSSDDVTAVTERLSRDGVTAATERLSRDDETAATERLSRDDETAVTERLSRDDETAVTERLSRDDVTAATERLSRDDVTAATERLSRDDVTAATERLSRDDVTAVTERFSRDDETAVTQRMSSDDVTAVTERLSRDVETAVTERMSSNDVTAATERLSRDDVTSATEKLSRDVGSLQLEQRAIGEKSRSLQKNVDGLAKYAKEFGPAGTVYSRDTTETVYSQDTAASSHNKMPSVDMEASVKVWGDNDKLCYETKGIKDVLQKIWSEEHNYICVVGEPGCGKSTAIRHAALYLKDKLGFIIYPVSGPKQFVDYLDPDKPQVGVIDDIIGEYFIDQDKLKLWDEYNEKIKDWLQVHKNTKVLFSLRVQLHSELKSKGNTHIYNDQRHVINFSDKEYKLSRDTMEDMLCHYLQVQHVQNIEGLIRRVRWGRAEQFAGCFPLLCKVFSEDESVRVDPEKYFSHPWPALQNIFTQIKSKNKHQFCGLLLCGVTDLKDEYFSTSYKQNKPQQFDSLIESQNLDPRKDLSDIKSALQALDGVYISHIGNRYTFLHSIFQNIVTFLYDDKYYVFKYATLDFIHTRVRLFSKFDTDDDYVKVFYGDDCVELLVDRMIEELRSDDRYRWWEGVRFIVDSHYIDNKELITCLMEKLFDNKHTQITQNKIDRLFGECLRTVCLYTLSPPHTDVTSSPQYQLLLSLIARCDCNKQIEWLLWEYPLLFSVNYGLLPVTKALVEHQADVNVVDSVCKRCVLHWAVDCRQNNVDMTKYLLSLPNLKCLNHRDSDGHTPYWYVVNNKSPTGYRSGVPHRDELMELYKHTAAICE